MEASRLVMMNEQERRKLAETALMVCNCEGGRYLWFWDSWRLYQEQAQREQIIKALEAEIVGRTSEEAVKNAQWILSASSADGLAVALPLAERMNKKLGVYWGGRKKWVGSCPDFEKDTFIAIDFTINYGGHFDYIVAALKKHDALKRLVAYAVVFDCTTNPVRKATLEPLQKNDSVKIVSLVTPDHFPESDILFPKQDEGSELSFVARRVFLEEEHKHGFFADTGHFTPYPKAGDDARSYTVDEWIKQVLKVGTVTNGANF